MHKQRGIVLFIVIMTLPLLLMLGFMVMQNTSIGLKITDARASLSKSNMTLLAASREMLGYKKQNTNTHKTMLKQLDSATEGQILIPVLFPEVQAKIFEIGPLIPCKRSKNAFDNDRFKCRYIRVQFEQDFGRQTQGKKWGHNILEVGIEKKIKY